MKSSTTEIELKSILAALARKWWIIALLTIIIGGGGNYLFQSQPGEAASTASASVLVSDGEDIKINMKTMTALMNEPAVLEQVAAELPWETNVATINSQILTEEVEGSQIIRVTATGSSPEEATTLANTLVSAFPEIADEKTGVNTVTILSEADVKEAGLVEAETSLTLPLIFIAVGIAGGIGAALLLDSVDHRVRKEQEVERLLEVPVLGSTSRIDRLSLKNTKNTLLKEEKRGEEIV